MHNTNTAEQSRKNLQTIITGASIDIFGRLVNTGLRYIWVMLLARLFGAQLLGLFFLSRIIIDVTGVISRLGLDNGCLKFVSLFRGKNDPARVKGTILNAGAVVFFVSLLAAALIYSGADFIAVRIFQKPDIIPALRILALALPFSNLMLISLASMQAMHVLKYKVYTENFALPVLNIVFSLIVYYTGQKLIGLTTAFACSVFLSAGLSMYYLNRLFPDLRTCAVKAIYSQQQLFRFSIPLLLVAFLNMVMMWTDSLMLGYFRSGEDVGIYNTVVRTAFFINFIIISFTAIFAPRISELYSSKNFDELRSLFKIVTRWIVTLSVPVFIIITVSGKQILSFFGAEFTAGFNALICLAVAHLINASVGSVQYILMMADKERLVMLNTIGVALFNIVLNLILIPGYGLTGAALATGCSIVIINLIMLAQVYFYVNMSPYNFKFAKPGIAGILAFTSGYFLQGEIATVVLPFINVLITATVICASYFMVLYILRIDENDLIFIDTLKEKFNNKILA